MAFLPYPPATTADAIDVFEQDVSIAHEVVHGADTETVLTEGGEIPTIAKLIKDLSARVNNVIPVDVGNAIFDDVVTVINQDLTNTIAAATADKLNASQVQDIVDESLALAEDPDANDVRIEIVNSALSAISDYGTKAGLRRTDIALAGEKQTRAAAILQLNANNQAQLQRIDMVETNLNGTNQAVSQVSAQVNNPTTGLTATFDIAQQAKSTAEGVVNSTTLIQNQVNDPTTGLAATASLAQNAKITADDASSSASALTNTINNPTTGLVATSVLAQQAKTTADGNTQAISGIRTSVAGVDDQTQAQLVLSSTVSKAGAAFSRAFLGVTTTSGGVSRINGIVVDGATNTLEFRADTLRLTNTAGGNELYFDAGRGKWLFGGDLVAATFQTATSGYRAEMSGTGTIPFWYGTGTKDWTTALFGVDNAGNVKIQNAQIQGRLVTDSGTGYRTEVYDDGTYLLWIGTGDKNDTNGMFWLKKNGTGFIKGQFFQGEIIETKFGVVNASDILPTSVYASNHSSAGKAVEITATTSINYRSDVSGIYPAELRLQILRDGVVIKTQSFYTMPIEGLGSFVIHSASVSVTAIDTSTSVGARNYEAVISHVSGPTPASNLIIDGTIKTFENKLG